MKVNNEKKWNKINYTFCSLRNSGGYEKKIVSTIWNVREETQKNVKSVSIEPQIF